MAVLAPPVARHDWQGACWAAGAGAVFSWGMSAAAVIKFRQLPFSIFKFASFYPQFSQLSWKDQASLTAPAVAAAAVGCFLFWLVAKEKTRTEIQGEGGQLRDGAGAAKAEISKEAALSEVIFEAGGIRFTLDRIRRSFVILGSIGGGKTQVIWNLLAGFRKAGFRVLLIDGPKGDYSSSTPGNPLIISPWSDGPAWHIAADCRTRGHARELASSLIPGNDKDPIWSNAAQMIFVAIICKLQSEKATEWGWSDLYDHITLPIPELYGIARQHYPPAMQILFDAESKTTQSVVINLTAFMQDVFEMALAWRNAEKRFSFVKWWKGGYKAGISTVILQGSGEFKSLSGGYISSIVNVLANLTASPSFEESKTRKNVIIIDEMAQLPRLQGVEKFLEIGRSKGCSAVFATQSPSQLRKVYGQDDLSSWFAMVGSKIFVRIIGADDSEVALRELGEREVYLPTTSSTSGGGDAQQSVTQGWQREKVEVVRAEQLKELGPCKHGITAILEGVGKDPIRLTFPFYDTQPLRPVFLENPDFNQQISLIQNTNENLPAGGGSGEVTNTEQVLPVSPADLCQKNKYLSDAPASQTVAMISDEIILNSSDFINSKNQMGAGEVENPAEPIIEKILDEAANPVASMILGDAGSHLLDLLQEVQEASAVDSGPASTTPLQQQKRRKRWTTLDKKREAEGM